MTVSPSSCVRRARGAAIVFTVLAVVVAAATLAGASPASAPATHAKESGSGNDYCAANSATVHAQAPRLLAALDKVVTFPFFRYFKVNVDIRCPYWAVTLLCTGHRDPTSKRAPCDVCKCGPDEVPFELRATPDMGTLEGDGGSAEAPAGTGVATAKAAAGAVSALTSDFPESFEEDEWETGEWDTHADRGPSFVDLVRNPEGNTGYVGEFAHRIWRAVYDENCFLPTGDENSGSAVEDAASGFTDACNPPTGDRSRSQRSAPCPGRRSDLVAQCSEQLVFFRLISGLHASISTHIALHFFPDGTDAAAAAAIAAAGGDVPLVRMGPNCPEFHRRVLSHPRRIENLHLIYLFVARAVTRAKEAFLSPEANVYAGASSPEAEEAMRGAMRHLFDNELLCSATFNETKILDSPEGRKWLPRMELMMRNITTLMNCLTCEKCRVWGKLQTVGLAAAFEIVMATPGAPPPALTRAKLVALLNFLRQLSVSVVAVANPPAACVASPPHREDL